MFTAYAGEIFSLLSAMFWGLAVVFFKQIGDRVSPIVLNPFKNGLGVILISATLLLTGNSLLPEKAFDSFGLTIIDEVHRIGSEQFSKTLLRVLSPNMLGISATVDRKDKLTCVLYMFIGPKIYTEARKDEDPVCVRSIEYISSDSQFNETEYDHKSLIEFVEDRKGHDIRYGLNINKLKKKLLWEPKHQFSHGIEKTIYWFEKNKKWWGKLI